MHTRASRPVNATISAGVPAGPPTLPIRATELRSNNLLLRVCLLLIALLAVVIVVAVVAFFSQGGLDGGVGPRPGTVTPSGAGAR